jgi:hypothetical protein
MTTKLRPLLARDVQAYRLSEDLTEALIYLMALFSPWAFGTTDDWSMWVMNAGGYALGVLLAVKLAIRWLKGHRPPRWERKPAAERLTAALAGLTVAIPVYCLTAALNARGTYHREMLGFDYHDYIKWLPASFDSSSTWFVFWCSLALACSFWAARDWLLGKSSAEERAEWLSPKLPHKCGVPAGSGTPHLCGSEELRHAPPGEPVPFLPARWRRLLWALTINGGLLAVEGIVQRLANCPRLLFLVLPAVHQTADTQFGPYAYRSSAAQYFNLLWPVSLGFWWAMGAGREARGARREAQGAGRRAQGAGRKAPHLALLCASIMAACPIISTTRAGALIAVGLLILATLFLLASQLGQGWVERGGGLVDWWIGGLVSKFSYGRAQRDEAGTSAEQRRVPAVGVSHRYRTAVVLGVFLMSSLTLGFVLGWKALKPRMAQFKEGYEYRERMYANARPMAADYPVYGIGPGAFVYVFQLYRVSTGTYWPPELHNDWLETRISFGWVGSGLIALALALAWLRWFLPGGLALCAPFTVMIWLALGGCLVHARFDFPFQVYSVVFLFLIWCAMLVNVSRKSGGLK